MDVILHTFGTCISRDNGGFVITGKDGKQRLSVSQVDSIQICRGVQITSDAILLAIENEIEILFIQNNGHPLGRVWSNRYGSISTIRKGQLAFTSSEKAVTWIKKILSQKIVNQQALLLAMDIDNKLQKNRIDRAISRMEEYRIKINKAEAPIVNDIANTLRGWEGSCSKIYFETVNIFLPEEYRFNNRTQHPATDVCNAMLNYGYGILYGKVEGALIKAGIDPYIGILHRDNYRRPVLVYDVIELYRIWIDYIVFTLLCQHAVSEEYYSKRPDGSVWMENLGRRVLIQSVNDYLEEQIVENSLRRSRETHINLYAQSLAQEFKAMDKWNFSQLTSNETDGNQEL